MSGISKINDSLVVIPARAVSKGVKGKNVKKLNFKPLIEYTLEFAIKNFEIKNIVVSTDSDEVIKISENLGIRVQKKCKIYAFLCNPQFWWICEGSRVGTETWTWRSCFANRFEGKPECFKKKREEVVIFQTEFLNR